MWAIELQSHGFAGLRRVERPQRRPVADEILIRMVAASVNYRDLVVIAGRYRGTLPVVPLSDGAGLVVETGDNVQGFAVGDRVCPVFAPGWQAGPPQQDSLSRSLGADTDGTLQEYMVVRAQDAVRTPDHLSHAQAACLPCAALTAWSAVMVFGRVQPGQIVLVEGTGGVALAALQFARAAGAQVALVSSSDQKLQRARQLGADYLINYKAEPEWGAAIRKATGAGVDLVVELGGAATLPQALAALKFGGRVAQIGLLGGVAAQLPLQLMVPRAVTLQGISVGSTASFQAMARAIALHRIHPVVHVTAPLDQANDAIAALAKGDHFGKITINTGG